MMRVAGWAVLFVLALWSARANAQALAQSLPADENKTAPTQSEPAPASTAPSTSPSPPADQPPAQPAAQPAAQAPAAPFTPHNPPTADDICRALEQDAAENQLPVEFFARVIWQESRFNAQAVSA